MTILLLATIPEAASTTELVRMLYKNSVYYGLALVFTAVIQTGQGKMDLYHALFVMQIIFSLIITGFIHTVCFLPAQSSSSNRWSCRYEKICAVVRE